MNGKFAQAYLGIGEVLVELRGDFPDISVSKIRFLESEGLISPARSPSGYRRFGPADVDQLRFILASQRDQYLPLRVIKERLEYQAQATAAGRDGPASTTLDGSRDSGAAPQDRRPGQDRAEMVTRRDLLEAADIDESQLAELEAHGLVRRIGRLYGQDALDVAATVGALAPYGVQARNLHTVRTAAERDVSLIEQLVAPILRQRSPSARDAAGRSAREIAALLLRLHRAMIESALAEAGLPGEELPGHSIERRHAVTADQRGSDLSRPGAKGASA